MKLAPSLYMAALALPALAAAQVPAGHPDPQTGQVPQNLVSAQIGRCVVKRDRKNASSYVLVRGGDAAFGKVLARLMPAMEKCLGGARSATLDPAYLRGGIAEGLLHEDGDALLAKAAAQPVVAPRRLTGTDAKEPVVALMACAAGAQPADAVAMLRSPPESVAEATAFRSLVPALQACAPATGELRFSPARVRPAAAIALYRMVAG